MHHMTVHSGATWRIRWMNLCAGVVQQLNRQTVTQMPLGVDL